MWIEKAKILNYVEVSFLSRHYDLTVDYFNMKEKGPTKETPHEVIIIYYSPVNQKPDDKRHDIKREIEKEQTFSNQNSSESTIMEIRIKDSECSSSDSDELINAEESKNNFNIPVTSSDENLIYNNCNLSRKKETHIAPDIF